MPLRDLKKLTSFMILMFSAKLYAAGLPNELLKLPIHLISGESVSLAQYKGKKPVYLKFWASWCQPCMKEMPHFEQVESRYGKSIEVIGINLGINDDMSAVNNVIERFGLTMPLAIDKNGDLAQSFKMIGTPFHLLFDRDMNLIHRGHEANELLDNKLDLVSQIKPVDLLDVSLLSDSEPPLPLSMDDGKIHALFFTATWCDWYLKDSRPEASKNCILAQKSINELSMKHPDIVWHGIVSRLWTGENDLVEYKNKYEITYDLNIDKSNQWFHRYSVKDLPTLVVINNGEVISKVTDFNKVKNLETLLSK